MKFALLAIALAGCSQMLGLGTTVGDRDHDGIPDDRDDCPDDYDPKQLDADHDGIGDACGPCHSLTHDFDHDGRDDACDGCIGPGPIGVDSDGDGIDDGCEPCVGGVDQTGEDLDHDGIGDGCDPCVASGIDRDQDGIDDACDACLLGPPHDEDGDGIDDACDDCPADPDPDQTRAMGHTLGVACDPDPEGADIYTRRLFDPFHGRNNNVWPPGSDIWSFGMETVTAMGQDSSLDSFYDVRGYNVVRTSVQFTSSAVPSDGLGINLVSDGGPIFFHECYVTADGFINGVTSTGAGALDPSGPIELSLVETGGSPQAAYCEGRDVHGAKMDANITMPATGTLRIQLEDKGNGNGSFAWIDAVDHPIGP